MVLFNRQEYHKQYNKQYYQNVTKDKRKRKPKEKPKEYIYAFDIETSDTKNDISNPKMQELYHKDGIHYAFMHQMTVSRIEYESEIVEHLFQTTWIEDFQQWLEMMLIQNKETILISHNFGGYEFHWLKNYKWFTDMCVECLAYSESRVITVTLQFPPDSEFYEEFGGHKIKILDSLTILGKSIKDLGEELKFPKLDYDYSEFQMPTDSFTEDKIDYCYRDNDISLIALVRQAKLYGWIKKPKDIPCTKTGFVRKEFKKNPNINILKKERVEIDKKGHKHTHKITLFDDWSWLCRNQFITDPQTYRLITNSFNGGYVHCNPFVVGQVIKNLFCIDFKSDYPGQMTNNAYPTGEYVVIENETFDEYVYPSLLKISKLPPEDIIRRCQILDGFYTMRLMLKGVVAKGLNGEFNVAGNIFPNISQSKTQVGLVDRIGAKSRIVDNGKVIQADFLEVYLTDVELLNILLCYNIDEIVCIEICRCMRSGNSPILQNAINYYGKNKEQWKKMIHDLEHGNIVKVDVPEDELERVLSQDSIDKMIDLAKQYLLISKQNLNSLYGMNVQKPVLDKYIITDKGIQKVEADLESMLVKPSRFEELNHSFPYGCYVTAYARLALTLGFIMLDKYGYMFIYCDTDSIKFIATDKSSVNAETVVDMYNTAVSKKYYFKNNQHNFGFFDFEPSYDMFISLGAKKYMVLQHGKVHCTNAGLNQHRSDEIYNEILKYQYKGDFEKMALECYHHNIYIDADCTDKLGHSYITEGKDMGKFYPELKGKNVLSMVTLDDAPFSMNTTFVNRETTVTIWCHILEKAFHNPQNISKGHIKKKKDKRFKKGFRYCYEQVPKIS